MSQHTRTRGLIILTVLLTAVIALGLLFYQDDEVSYELDPSESLQTLAQDFSFLSLEKAREVAAADSKAYTFIDIRSAGAFSKGHLPGAVHIPLYELLASSTLNQLQVANQTYVLYGDDISDGASACALLKQVGLTNIQALQGDYNTYSSGIPSPIAEAPNYDYAKVFEEVGLEERGSLTAPPPVETAPKVILPVKRVTKPASEGC